MKEKSSASKDSKMNKKRTFFMVVIVLCLLAVLGYNLIQMAERRVRDNLLADMEWLQQACREDKGCHTVPEDWIVRDCKLFPQLVQDLPAALQCVSPPEKSPYRALAYRATADEFVARWRYVADIELFVRGGKNRRLIIEEVAVKQP